MILDKVHDCLFCGTKLKTQTSDVGKILHCPTEKKHLGKSIWCWYDEEDKNIISALNIRIDKHQLHWHFIKKETRLLACAPEFNKTIIKFDDLIDMEQITEETISTKMKTLLVFM
jgi:hypothetical protein